MLRARELIRMPDEKDQDALEDFEPRPFEDTDDPQDES